MPFRNPLYVDQELMANLADYFAVPLPTEGEVVRRVLDERGGRLGVNRVVDASRHTGATEEVTETYTSTVRPVRAVNDVVDHLLADGAPDLVSVPDAELVLRHPIQVDGDLTLSTATEVGGLFARFMPLLAAQAAQGSGDPDLSSAQAAELMLTAPTSDHIHIFELAGQPDTTFVLPVRPACLYGGAAMDDLEGECTVFGVVDRLVPEGASYSLERHVLPGLNRTLRRAFPRDKLLEMLQGFAQMSGGSVDANALEIQGPAALVTPLAIY